MQTEHYTYRTSLKSLKNKHFFHNDEHDEHDERDAQDDPVCTEAGQRKELGENQERIGRQAGWG